MYTHTHIHDDTPHYKQHHFLILLHYISCKCMLMPTQHPPEPNNKTCVNLRYSTCVTTNDLVIQRPTGPSSVLLKMKELDQLNFCDVVNNLRRILPVPVLHPIPLFKTCAQFPLLSRSICTLQQPGRVHNPALMAYKGPSYDGPLCDRRPGTN